MHDFNWLAARHSTKGCPKVALERIINIMRESGVRDTAGVRVEVLRRMRDGRVEVGDILSGMRQGVLLHKLLSILWGCRASLGIRKDFERPLLCTSRVVGLRLSNG